MAKSILCPIDFSESSLHALRCAVDLSSRYNCHLAVLYPFRLIQTSKDEVLEAKKKNEEQAVVKFESLKSDYLNGKTLSFSFSPEVGFLSDRIEDHLRKNSILFMVIGKNMNASNQENLDDVLKHAHVPVVFVP